MVWNILALRGSRKFIMWKRVRLCEKQSTAPGWNDRVPAGRAWSFRRSDSWPGCGPSGTKWPDVLFDEFQHGLGRNRQGLVLALDDEDRTRLRLRG